MNGTMIGYTLDLHALPTAEVVFTGQPSAASIPLNPGEFGPLLRALNEAGKPIPVEISMKPAT